MPDGYVPPSTDNSILYDQEWEATIELHLKKLDTKTAVALGCGIAGMGLGLLANFMAKKLVDSLQNIGGIVGTLHQIESQRGTFGDPIVQGPAGAHSVRQADYSPQQEWGAIRPDTSHIGRTTPSQSPGVDDSQRPYDGSVSQPTEGPVSEVSDEARARILSDAILPKNVVKDEGIH